jgi:hypothetical protein
MEKQMSNDITGEYLMAGRFPGAVTTFHVPPGFHAVQAPFSIAAVFE